MLQLRAVSFKSLKSMSIQDRTKAFRDERGNFLFSMLTPTEFAELFPKYYQQALPDVSGFMKALPSSYSMAKQKMYEQQLGNTVSGSKEGLAFGPTENWRKRIDRTISEQTAGKSNGLKPEIKMTDQQNAAYNKIKQGPVALDSTEGKVFSNLSQSALQKGGLEIYEDPKTHQKMMRYNETTVSTADAEKSLRTNGRDGNSFFNAIIRAEGTAKHGDPYETSLGYMKSPKPLTEMTMAEALTWGEQVRSAQGLNSSAKGAFQIVNTTQKAAMKALGLGMNEKFSPENQRKMASWIAKQQGLGAWEGLKIHKEQWAEAESAMRQGLHNQTGGGVKPEGPNGQYSDAQIAKMQEQLKNEKNEQRRQNIAYELSTIPGTPQYAQVNGQAPSGGGSDLSGVSSTAVGNAGSHVGAGKECADLSKHYAPGIGKASGWTFHQGQDGMVPGAVIATRTYGPDGVPIPGGPKAGQKFAGGAHAADLGGSYYHTGVLLTRPDAQGNALIYDQSAKIGTRITKVNVNNYHGSGVSMGVVNGGEASDRSKEAVNNALQIADPAQKQAIQASLQGKAPETVAAAPDGAKLQEQKKETTIQKDHDGNPLVPEQGAPPTARSAGVTELTPGRVGENPIINQSAAPAGDSGGGDADKVLATIRARESGGNYSAKASGSSASGAYQFIDGTWQSLTKKYGIGGEYSSAGSAPKEVQDAVAKRYVSDILKENGGDVSKVPMVWYTGNAQGNMSAEALAANKGLTAQAYQANWMKDFAKNGGSGSVSTDTASPAPDASSPTPTQTADASTTPSDTTAQAPTDPQQMIQSVMSNPQGAIGAILPKVLPQITGALGGGSELGAIAPIAQQLMGGMIPGHAGGGKEKITGSVDVKPIEPQRGDNALVTDSAGKQFTINTNKETASVNPQSSVMTIKHRSDLGHASAKYESGGKGVDAISTGKHDKGGVSYGAHQLASRTGTMKEYLNSPEGSAYKDQFGKTRPGSKAFNEIYSRIAKEDPQGFATSQHSYITRTHYEPIRAKAESYGYNVNDPRVQEALYSMSVQHRHASNSLLKSPSALSSVGQDPSKQVEALYDARTSKYKRFSDRYDRERKDVASMDLSKYNDQSAQSTPVQDNKTVTPTGGPSATPAPTLMSDVAKDKSFQTSALPEASSKIKADIKPMPMGMTNQDTASNTQKDNQTKETAQNTQMQRQQTSDTMPISDLLDASRHTFKSPSSMRAFARANFGETGDAIDGFKYSRGNVSTA